MVYIIYLLTKVYHKQERKSNMDFSKIVSDEILQKTAEALKNNGFDVEIAENGAEAKEKALASLPEGAEVLTATSITLDTIGATQEINESGKYNSVKNQLAKMDRTADHKEMQKLGAAPEYEIGSAHAVTQDGKVIIASGTGSQLPGEVYGASHVIWVVGAQKIVSDLNQALQRINEYIVPLESVRARKAYGLPDSWNTFPSKILITNREPVKGRTKIILVKEALGF